MDENKNRSRRAAVLWSAAGILLCLGICGSAWLRGAFLPKWVRWEERTETIRIPEDHELFLPEGAPAPAVIGEAELQLSGKRVGIRETAGDRVPEGGSVKTYRSPVSWLVQDALVCDLNGDGADEVILLVWKRGSFGGARPFWVTRDEIGFSEHIFIFKYMNGTLRPLWMSSKMGIPVQSVTYGEDGKLHLSAPDGTETVWEWNRWGLTLAETGV